MHGLNEALFYSPFHHGRIASLSKIFPVLMLYKLWEDGEVASLDDPFEKYVENFTIKNPLGRSSGPGQASPWAPRARFPSLTLRRMASQLSGEWTPHSSLMCRSLHIN